MESLSKEDRSIWRAIRKDLEDIGISVGAFEANRDFILRWLSHAIETGAFEERRIPDSENESMPESPFNSNDNITEAGSDGPSITASTQVYRGIKYHDSTSVSDQALPIKYGSEFLTRFTQPLPVDGCGPSSQPKLPSSTLPTLIEYSISCERCGKFNIAYDLHMNCETCNDGDYNLCLQCWRHGRGCLNWYGFGQSAVTFWNHTVSSKAIDSLKCAIPHILTGRQYRHVAIRALPADSEDCAPLIEILTASNVEL